MPGDPGPHAVRRVRFQDWCRGIGKPRGHAQTVRRIRRHWRDPRGRRGVGRDSRHRFRGHGPLGHAVRPHRFHLGRAGGGLRRQLQEDIAQHTEAAVGGQSEVHVRQGVAGAPPQGPARTAGRSGGLRCHTGDSDILEGIAGGFYLALLGHGDHEGSGGNVPRLRAGKPSGRHDRVSGPARDAQGAPGARLLEVREPRRGVHSRRQGRGCDRRPDRAPQPRLRQEPPGIHGRPPRRQNRDRVT